MPSPFPGMNPYLEHPELFPGVHHYLISEIARFLSPQLRPKYGVAVEVRMYELRPGDTEPILDLQTLLNNVYDLYGYDLVVNYQEHPALQLTKHDAAWVDTLLCEQGFRNSR